MVKRPDPIAIVADSRRALLMHLKERGWSTIPKIADALSISTEAVRQHLTQLEKEGWVVSNCGPDQSAARGRGRPPVEYCLSRGGDDLFLKKYAQLAIEFFDSMKDPIPYLTRLTDDRTRAIAGKDLQSIYVDGDPFTSLETTDDGYMLIERNCPYLGFAAERPLFCSTTVSTLRRVTGCEVVREQRFQDRDGRCVFRIYTDRPLSERRRKIRFEKEPPKRA